MPQSAEIMGGLLSPAQRISPLHSVSYQSIAGWFRSGGQVICGRFEEAAMTREDAHLLGILVEQLTGDLRSAASRAVQINEIIVTCVGDGTVLCT